MVPLHRIGRLSGLTATLSRRTSRSRSCLRRDTRLDALQVEVDALKRLQAETAAELDALLPSILDRAFKGEF